MNYKKTLLWYWRISSDKRLMLGGIVLFQIGYILGTVLTPVLEAHVLQRLVDGELTAEYLTWFAVVYVVIRVVLSELFLRAALHLHQVEFTQNLQRVRLYAYNHIINRNVSFQNNNFSGALLNKINTFASSSAVIKGQLMFNFLPTSISLLVACAYALIALPLVGAVTVITSTATVIYAYHATKQRSKLNRIFAKHRSSAVGLMADGLTNIHAVKAEANEHVEAAMTSKKLQETRNAQLKSNIYKNFRIDIVTSLSAKVVQTTALIAAAHYALNGQISIAALYLIIRYVGEVSNRFFQISESIKATEEALSNAQEMTEILEESYTSTDKPGAKGLVVKRGQIDFLGTSFRYTDSDDTDHVFEDFSLSIPAGQSVGIVGASGSGKSTLTSLLLRFNRPESGEIRIDGQNIDDATASSLAASIAYVPQEPLLFHRSIADNIAYGKQDASLRQIKAAARKAHATEFIDDLPNTYDTLVGERGVKLSGGQKQRVAIARAILKNSPILLLDEATSALDSESEQYIQESLFKMMKNRTTIVIAHRLSTIQKLDRIIVLDNGQIIEDGPHSELIKKRSGTYAKLWKHQSGGFL